MFKLFNLQILLDKTRTAALLLKPTYRGYVLKLDHSTTVTEISFVDINFFTFIRRFI